MLCRQRRPDVLVVASALSERDRLDLIDAIKTRPRHLPHRRRADRAGGHRRRERARGAAARRARLPARARARGRADRARAGGRADEDPPGGAGRPDGAAREPAVRGPAHARAQPPLRVRPDVGARQRGPPPRAPAGRRDGRPRRLQVRQRRPRARDRRPRARRGRRGAPARAARGGRARAAGRRGVPRAAARHRRGGRGAGGRAPARGGRRGGRAGGRHGERRMGRAVRRRAPDDLVRRADNALYEAKAAGRNCVRGAATLPRRT